MKKLLGIVVLGLFICNLSYANTPVQQFVFEKLYDEYSKCTVYYKFTGRGIERKKDVAELTEKENLFLSEMNNLSKESEKNMFFFSQKLKISNQDVQSNIKKIYTSFLDIAGRDYSKTEILNEKYYHICITAIEDPESRMIYWDVEFQKIKDNVQNISNKVLTCTYFNDWEKKNIIFGIFFRSDEEAIVFHIRDFELIEAKYNLRLEINIIRFSLHIDDWDKYENNNLPDWFHFKRDGLKFSYKYKIKLGNEYDLQIINCELNNMSSIEVLRKFMNKILQKNIKNQKKQNKI